MTMRKLDILWKRHRAFTMPPESGSPSKSTAQVKVKKMETDAKGRVPIDALDSIF